MADPMQSAVEMLARAMFDAYRHSTSSTMQVYFDDARRILAEIAPLIRTPDPLLAEALEALRFYADENRSGLPSDGPWGLGSNDFGRRARAVLAKMDAARAGKETT